MVRCRRVGRLGSNYTGFWTSPFKRLVYMRSVPRITVNATVIEVKRKAIPIILGGLNQ